MIIRVGVETLASDKKELMEELEALQGQLEEVRGMVAKERKEAGLWIGKAAEYSKELEAMREDRRCLRVKADLLRWQKDRNSEQALAEESRLGAALERAEQKNMELAGENTALKAEVGFTFQRGVDAVRQMETAWEATGEALQKQKTELREDYKRLYDQHQQYIIKTQAQIKDLQKELDRMRINAQPPDADLRSWDAYKDLQKKYESTFKDLRRANEYVHIYRGQVRDLTIQYNRAIQERDLKKELAEGEGSCEHAKALVSMTKLLEKEKGNHDLRYSCLMEKHEDLLKKFKKLSEEEYYLRNRVAELKDALDIAKRNNHYELPLKQLADKLLEIAGAIDTRINQERG